LLCCNLNADIPTQSDRLAVVVGDQLAGPTAACHRPNAKLGGILIGAVAIKADHQIRGFLTDSLDKARSPQTRFAARGAPGAFDALSPCARIGHLKGVDRLAIRLRHHPAAIKRALSALNRAKDAQDAALINRVLVRLGPADRIRYEPRLQRLVARGRQWRGRGARNPRFGGQGRRRRLGLQGDDVVGRPVGGFRLQVNGGR
jgi:hypothetical protein